MSGHLRKGDVDVPGKQKQPSSGNLSSHHEVSAHRAPTWLCGPPILPEYTHTHARAHDIKVIFLIAGKA